jgi:hypothetical protein
MPRSFRSRTRPRRKLTAAVREECHEGELPTALVKSKGGFHPFEVGVKALRTNALQSVAALTSQAFAGSWSTRSSFALLSRPGNTHFLIVTSAAIASGSIRTLLADRNTLVRLARCSVGYL